MVTLPPWLVGVVIVYVIALTSIFGYLFMEQVQRKRRKPAAGHDAEILAVAEQGLAEAPELADDTEAVARTVLALEEVAELRRLARADGEEAAFVSPGHRRLDAFLDEVLDRRRR